MGYYNPVLAYGEQQFAADAREAGADGLIIPDLPPEEAEELAEAAASNGLAFVRFVAPTTNAHRLPFILGSATGFVYLVSVTGVTGARTMLSSNLASLVAKVRRFSSLPVAVGFGISRPDQAAEVGRIADGVIVGSALIDVVRTAKDKPAAAAAFVRQLKEAITTARLEQPTQSPQSTTNRGLPQ
jgi:tryptophan synthase alpha chain